MAKEKKNRKVLLPSHTKRPTLYLFRDAFFALQSNRLRAIEACAHISAISTSIVWSGFVCSHTHPHTKLFKVIKWYERFMRGKKTNTAKIETVEQKHKLRSIFCIVKTFRPNQLEWHSDWNQFECVTVAESIIWRRFSAFLPRQPLLKIINLPFSPRKSKSQSNGNVGRTKCSRKMANHIFFEWNQCWHTFIRSRRLKLI